MRVQSVRIHLVSHGVETLQYFRFKLLEVNLFGHQDS